MKTEQKTIRSAIETYGADILASDGMKRERGFRQHGNTSVYDHSLAVTEECLRVSRTLGLRVNERALVRGALLHDYFLYDWHNKSNDHRWHGFIHADRALRNATRDFRLGRIERDMIYCHMFPLNFRFPHYRESVILCLADKFCALREILRWKDAPGTK